MTRSARASTAGITLLSVLALACTETPELRVETEPSAAAVPTASATPPRVVALDPPQGAVDVAPGEAILSATFDREMNRDGWAWLREDGATAPELGESWFDPTGRTSYVQATLEPGVEYVLWINSAQIRYFESVNGTPSVPVRWTFRTAGAAPAAPSSLARGGAPRIETLEPANGATGVDPALTSLRVTFDRPMAEGWSWVTEPGTSFPEANGRAFFEPDGRTNVLPVRLRPSTTYVVWLNSAEHRGFASRPGIPLAPVRWEFSTGAGGS